MADKSLKRIVRPATTDERGRHAAIREKVMQEFPPASSSGLARSPGGLPERIRAARVARRLTWYAVAKLAGVPNSNTVRDIEAGRDAQLSSVIAVANAVGLQLELVEQGA